MSHRYRFIGSPLASASASSAGVWILDADESFHLTKVLRLQAGDEIEVMDGAGNWGIACITEAHGKTTHVQILESYFEPAPAQSLTIALGALKPGAIDEVLPALIELGVDEIKVFQQSDTAKTRLHDKAQERWGRISITAAKQCKRARLPAIKTYDSLAAMLAEQTRQTAAQVRRFVLSPLAQQPLIVALEAATEPTPIELILGGERGLDPQEELILQQAAYQPVNFGHFILRSVTAVIAATAVAAQVRHRQSPSSNATLAPK